MALESEITDQALRAYYNLADVRLLTGRTPESAELVERGLALAGERGDRSWERDILSQTNQAHVFCGRWDQAIALAFHVARYTCAFIPALIWIAEDRGLSRAIVVAVLVALPTSWSTTGAWSGPGCSTSSVRPTPPPACG